MSDPMMKALQRLLETSLEAWQLTGKVGANGAGLVLNSRDTELSIAKAPTGMPFRWVVTIDGRRRTAASVNGVLRVVRQTLAPEYQPLSLRIAPLPAKPLSPQGAS